MTLTLEQRREGVYQARRIIQSSAGYYLGGVLTPFSESFKDLALKVLVPEHSEEVLAALEYVKQRVKKIEKELHFLEYENSTMMRTFVIRQLVEEWDYLKILINALEGV